MLAGKESEGVVIGVVRNRTADGYGVQLDLSNAPVPERRFSADGGWVVPGTDIIRIVFAQYKGVGPEVEHYVVLRVSFDGVRMFVQSMKSVSETGHAFLEKIGNPPSPEIDRKSISAQSFTLDANIIIAGYSGREACMDLYYSSPQVKVALRRGGNEYRAEPVARVMLTTRLLLDIYQELALTIQTLPADDEQIEVEVEHDD